MVISAIYAGLGISFFMNPIAFIESRRILILAVFVCPVRGRYQNSQGKCGVGYLMLLRNRFFVFVLLMYVLLLLSPAMPMNLSYVIFIIQVI